MKITIDSNKLMFGADATCYEAFKYLQLCLTMFTKNFPQQYKFSVLNDIDGVEAGFIYGIVKSFKSFGIICKDTTDYASAATICRAIVDKIAIIKCIYSKTDQEERMYRYYLYVLDGMRERMHLLNENLPYNGKIRKVEYEALVSQVNDAKESSNEAIKYCEKELNNHKYASLNPEFHKKIISKACWRFKTFGSVTKNGTPDTYSWKELYSLIDNRPEIVSMYSSYLSQFVHSLSISILPNNNVTDDFDSLMGVAICLQGVVINELKLRFNVSSLTNNYNPEELNNIISHLSPKYIWA